MLDVYLLFNNDYLLANVAYACQTFVEEEKERMNKDTF